ncbi:hypothetical protein XHC_1258 [Xanthomonas hortorum pv. carotae str. M081]|nr:hypothetical protein XHC_1258 [Xanthomonas hortorum pv. carotae str. M081]
MLITLHASSCPRRSGEQAASLQSQDLFFQSMRVERERALMVLRYFAPSALPHHVCERY